MKKTISLIAIISILFTACSKSGGSGTPTPSILLNSKEKLLLGHWQLQKVTDSSGVKSGSGFTPTIKSETNYSSTDFVELQDKKEFSKNYEAKIKDARIAGAGAFLSGINSPKTGLVQDHCIWYYDEGILKLVLETVSYDVISLSTNQLILWRSNLTGSYYTSYTATYSK